ncbi:MAG: HAMP domain-containing histidine kinase [Desulfobacula sp.]|nr:HAMP domain-containing histidine kinase [Desulfobacula sp.]
MKKNEEIDELTQEGFRFFGKMSASATHEIKNTLAIINENLGLMDDLAMMAQDGMLSCDQINRASKSIKKQVERSNNILKKLNKFSHSVDLSKQMADVETTVKFTLDLASRLIEMHEVTIEIISAPSHIGVNANQFFLENMIWKAVEAACKGAGKGKKVVVSFKQDSETLAVWFSMGSIEDGFMDNLFMSNNDKVLIEYLNIVVEKDKENNSFGLVWSNRN